MQTRLESLVEAFINCIVGYLVSFTANAIILPMVGIHVTVKQNLLIGAGMTVVSVARQYAIRRWAQVHLRRLQVNIVNWIKLMHTNLTAVSLFVLAAIYPLRWDDDTPPLPDERREEVLYDTVETLRLTDDQKADLYARIAEQLKADTPVLAAFKIIQRAIHACQFPG